MTAEETNAVCPERKASKFLFLSTLANRSRSRYQVEQVTTIRLQWRTDYQKSGSLD